MIEKLILGMIKKAADRYGEEVYDIVHNSPTKYVAYTRGYVLGGYTLAGMCLILWNNVHGGDGTPPPSAGMLLQQ